MKLAEALSLRADLRIFISSSRRLRECPSSLRRASATSTRRKVQEGDTPPEDIAVLEKEFDSLLGQLETLIYRINVTSLRRASATSTRRTVFISLRP